MHTPLRAGFSNVLAHLLSSLLSPQLQASGLLVGSLGSSSTWQSLLHFGQEVHSRHLLPDSSPYNYGFTVVVSISGENIQYSIRFERQRPITPSTRFKKKPHYFIDIIILEYFTIIAPIDKLRVR